MDKEKNTWGGYRIGSGIGKCGWFNEYWCDSTWELAWIIYHLDNNISFQRNTEKFKYLKISGKESNYIPDFIIDNVYIEIKGFKRNDVDQKLKYFPYKIKILYKEDMEFYLEYCYKKYNTKLLETIYDDKNCINKTIDRIFKKLKVSNIEEFIELRNKFNKNELQKLYAINHKHLKIINEHFNINFLNKKNTNLSINKNKKYNIVKKISYCECGAIKKIKSKNCKKCSLNNRKIIKDRPSIEILLKEVDEFGYEAIGRKYKVSGNCIKKWLKGYITIKKKFKNIGKPKCINCNIEIDYNSKLCKNCYQNKIKKNPPIEMSIIKNEYELNGVNWCSRKYLVDNKVIKRWIKEFI